MKICVFGASSNEINQKYISEGEQLGRLIAENNHTLIFGGGTTGLMGAVVRGVNEKNGYSIGVAPRFFNRPGILYLQCSEMIYTDGMNERKEYMETESDAFIITPGGIGTLDEFFGIFTQNQLGVYSKPICILNTLGFYDNLIELIHDLVEKGFLESKVEESLFVSDEPKKIINHLNEKIQD